MHYLVVAKVEDYPNFNELENSLMYIEPVSSDRWGDWEEIAASVEEFSKSNKDEINAEIDDEDMSFEDKVLAYLELCGFHLDNNGSVWQKVSDHFDYCTLGGRFSNDNLENIVPYKKVIEEYGEVDAFVLSDYDFYYTDDNKCPFEPDDLVYVIDGHN